MYFWLENNWEEAKALPGNIFELYGNIFEFHTKFICVEIEIYCSTNIFLDNKWEEAKARPGDIFFKHIQIVQKQPYLCDSVLLLPKSRSSPYILDTLDVPIRSDQDNKVETCLLKQSISLLSRPTTI